VNGSRFGSLKTRILTTDGEVHLPDNIYYWLVDFFSGHSHCTRYCDQTSMLLEISASIGQGSVIGPISYVVTTADLVAVTPRNKLCKYADDTYVIIPT